MRDRSEARMIASYRRWYDTVATVPAVVVACLGLLAALTGCSRIKTPEIPSVLEITGKTLVEGQMVVTARDTGTGCEVIITPNGIMPRNERSADGLSVKQRCVLTGTEQTAPGVTTTMLPADPAQTSAMSTQAADVAAAVREATAPAPTAREIPPPSGRGASPRAVPTRARTEPAPAPSPGGVESQLKK